MGTSNREKLETSYSYDRRITNGASTTVENLRSLKKVTESAKEFHPFNFHYSHSP